MGVSKNGGIPKWMVKIMENPIKMDDLGVPLFLEIPISFHHMLSLYSWELFCRLGHVGLQDCTVGR